MHANKRMHDDWCLDLPPPRPRPPLTHTACLCLPSPATPSFSPAFLAPPADSGTGVAVRIAGGGQRGRLEVFYSGSWGTICDDEFGTAECTVACRQLGYAPVCVEYIGSFGGGVGDVHADELDCTGDEASLQACQGGSSSWGSHDCSHNEDVGVQCRGYAGSCANGDLVAEASRARDDHCGSCRAGFFLNGTDCAACSHAACPGNQYRTGSCSGTRNGFECLAQPTCTAGQYLKHASSTAKGVCVACSNTACQSNEYRAGSCSGTNNGFECLAQPTCATGQYLKQANGTAKGVCVVCSNATCQNNRYRAGSCGGASDGFECVAQPTCAVSQYLKNASSTAKGACTARPMCSKGHRLENASVTSPGLCAKCPVGMFQPEDGYQGTACHAQATCKSVAGECFTKPNGADYRGGVARTKSGLACLSWSQQTKAVDGSGYWTGSSGAAEKGVSNHSYCRNPDGGGGVFCFTTSPAKRWELCDVGSPAAFCPLGIVCSTRARARSLHATLCTTCTHFGAGGFFARDLMHACMHSAGAGGDARMHGHRTSS